jgi:hypothetical protein
MTTKTMDFSYFIEITNFLEQIKIKREEAEWLLKQRHGKQFDQPLSEKFIQIIDSLGVGVPVEDIEVKRWFNTTLAILNHFLGENHIASKKFSKLEQKHTIDDPRFQGPQFSASFSRDLILGSFNTLDNLIEQKSNEIEILKHSRNFVTQNGYHLLQHQIELANNYLYPKEEHSQLDLPTVKKWREDTTIFLKFLIIEENNDFKKFLQLGNTYPGQRELLKESKELLEKMINSLYQEDNERHIPVEITDSLNHFKRDHPDPSKIAFIVMQFGKTRSHEEIMEGVKQELKRYGITGLRADDCRYHDDLLYNVLTYVYGCSFGVAIFERIEKEEFNSNVAFEVGYLMALSKPVCLLKDKTLKVLQTDLIGKLYEPFDPQNVIESISVGLRRWLQTKGIINIEK